MIWFVVIVVIVALVGLAWVHDFGPFGNCTYKEWKNAILSEPMTSWVYSKWGYSKVAELDLDTVLSIYKVNPNRFKIAPLVRAYNHFDKVQGSHILYNINQSNKIETYYGSKYLMKSFEIWEPETTIAILLPRKDYRKFLRWVRYEENRKEVVKKNEASQLILESAQKDIDKLKKQAEEEIDEARKVVERICDK